MSTFPPPHPPRLVAAIPWLACANLMATIEFFETKLGFTRDWISGEPPTDGGVVRDGVRLFLFEHADLAARASDSEITIEVENVDALFAEHKLNGAPIEMEIRNEPWGTREYTVREPNGYLLRFAGDPLSA
jgi:uncharacterized glyoxalase superfamily protein PhnB